MRSLLPLALQGTGTHAIEALPSYLTRLAASHGVTTGGLFDHLLNSYEGGAVANAALGSQPLAASVRPNATTERTIEVLAKASCGTVENLRQSTFLHLTPALARSRRSFSRRLRWCPGCLYEQAVAGVVPYLKLSWFFEDVKACDLHHILLRDTCPQCKRHPATGRWWPTFTACPLCEGRLDAVHASDRIDRDSEACGPDLISLVANIATRTEPFPTGSVNRYVDQVFDAAWASEREVELWNKLPRDECLRYSKIDEPITLPIARRIAYRLEVPIVELLSGCSPKIQSFGFASAGPLPLVMSPCQRSSVIDSASLRSDLERILKQETIPGSLRQVAHRLRVSVGAISYHCPELAAMVVRRRTAFKEAEAAERRSQARVAVRRAIADWSADDPPMSKKALLRRVYRESDLPKNLIRAEIHEQWR